MAFALPDAQAQRFFLGVEASVCGRAWRDRLDERGSMRALSIAQRHGLPELLARILAGRGVEPGDVEAFLDPTVKTLLPDPNVLTAMREAAIRIAEAVQGSEQIAIFGDYDVDGATSSALLARFLRHCGLDPFIHIPDRLFEGYGPNVEAVRALAERGAKLLITVDCGTTSIEPLEEAQRLGLQTIVIDHHQCDEKLPTALALVNPNRLDDLSKLGHLAAVGLERNKSYEISNWNIIYGNCVQSLPSGVVFQLQSVHFKFQSNVVFFLLSNARTLFSASLSPKSSFQWSSSIAPSTGNSQRCRIFHIPSLPIRPTDRCKVS